MIGRLVCLKVVSSLGLEMYIRCALLSGNGVGVDKVGGVASRWVVGHPKMRKRRPQWKYLLVKDALEAACVPDS